MKALRIIPADSICPHCQCGYMVTSTMYASCKQIGLHSRKIPAKCDNCGKRGHVVKSYIGVEVDVAPEQPSNQPNLFPNLHSV
jgi:hypothetical protein